MVRLKDIADAVGVSLPVVSRVLNPKPDKNAVIAEKTRLKILAAAEHLGYKRSRIAEFMAKGRAATIGVFLPDVANSLIAQIMMGISESSNRHGFPVSFFFGMNDESYLEFMEHIISNANSGMITYPNQLIYSAMLKTSIEKYIKTGGKVTFISPYSFDFEYEGAPVLGIDDFEGGKIAAKHLLGRHCACYVNCYPHNVINGPRSMGFAAVMQEAGHKIESLNLTETIVKMSAFKPCGPVKRLGIFANTDELALEVIKKAMELGFKVGEDVLLIGYDDLFLTDKLPVPLTTIHQPFQELGRLVMDGMVKLLYDQEVASLRLIPSLVKRQSA